MADAFYGPHFPVTCRECGLCFRCGIEHPPAQDLATCPNCGCGDNRVDTTQPAPGQRVLIDRWTKALHGLHTWQAVAFQAPQDAESTDRETHRGRRPGTRGDSRRRRVPQRPHPAERPWHNSAKSASSFTMTGIARHWPTDGSPHNPIRRGNPPAPGTSRSQHQIQPRLSTGSITRSGPAGLMDRRISAARSEYRFSTTMPTTKASRAGICIPSRISCWCANCSSAALASASCD